MRSSVICVFIAIIFSIWNEIDTAPLQLESARQFLPPMPGYIPVYIRQGDEPLENINADLAAAFRAYTRKHQIASGRAINELQPKLPAKAAAFDQDPSSHIQKIAPTKKIHT